MTRPADRVGSGKKVLEISRVEFDSGRGQEVLEYHGSGRVTLTRSGPKGEIQPVTSALEASFVVANYESEMILVCIVCYTGKEV